MTRSISRTFSRTFPVLGLAALLLPATLAAQTVYQWKDAKGVTHYSDSPPPKGEYSNRNMRVAESKPAAATAATTAAAKADARVADSSGPKPENAACAQARLNLAHLQGDAPVGPDADGDGKPDSTLDADGRAAQARLAQDAIKANCPPAA